MKLPTFYTSQSFCSFFPSFTSFFLLFYLFHCVYRLSWSSLKILFFNFGWHRLFSWQVDQDQLAGCSVFLEIFFLGFILQFEFLAYPVSFRKMLLFRKILWCWFLKNHIYVFIYHIYLSYLSIIPIVLFPVFLFLFICLVFCFFSYVFLHAACSFSCLQVIVIMPDFDYRLLNLLIIIYFSFIWTIIFYC